MDEIETFNIFVPQHANVLKPDSTRSNLCGRASLIHRFMSNENEIIHSKKNELKFE